jgi:DNA invertase Pin-like site-specific DNA recombinase
MVSIYNEHSEASAKEHLYGRKRRPSKGQDGTRTALYLRVSTADQKPDLQYDGLRAYAATASLEVVQDYCDVGVSGRREGRPQLNALRAAVRNREIDCVLVRKFDRFARSTRHLLTALEEFNHLGVRFISVQDQIDTDSPMGRAMFTIIGAMAELESSLISERVTAGMRAAESRGKHLGRPATQQRIIREIETLATSIDLSIRQIQSKIAELSASSPDVTLASLRLRVRPRGCPSHRHHDPLRSIAAMRMNWLGPRRKS